MHSAECPRENELLDALQSSRWPAACETSLREHVQTCRACTQLLSVVDALLADHRGLVQQASVPSSAVVWWRAQMRSRREAAERAAQPISFVQGIALACAAGLLATALGVFVPTFRRLAAWIAQQAGSWSGLSMPLVSDPLANPIVLAAIAALGLCALVLPLALYFTLHED
jgi:hypothetical protein